MATSLQNQQINQSYQKLVQKEGTMLYDGEGNVIETLTISASAANSINLENVEGFSAYSQGIEGEIDTINASITDQSSLLQTVSGSLGNITSPEWDSIQNKPEGLVTSSEQIAADISGSFAQEVNRLEGEIDNLDLLITDNANTITATSASLATNIKENTLAIATVVAGNSAAINLADTSGFLPANRIDGTIDADTLNGFTPSYYLDYDNFVDTPNIPTNVSELTNDAGYVTSIGNIPTLTSDLTNDSGFITSVNYADVSNTPTNVSELTNDVNYISSDNVVIPTKGSDLTNDQGWINSVDYSIITNTPTIPTTTNELTNDSGFITITDIPTLVDDVTYLNGFTGPHYLAYENFINTPTIPTTTNELTNNSGFLTTGDLPTPPDDVTYLNGFTGPHYLAYENFINTPTIPTTTEDLTNDSGFITTGDIPTIPTRGSELINDQGWINSVDYGFITNKPTIPTTTDELTNDAGFITAADVPTIPTRGSELINDQGWINVVNYNSIQGKPTIPTETSDLTNDSGFITTADLPAAVDDVTYLNGFTGPHYLDYDNFINTPTIPIQEKELAITVYSGSARTADFSVNSMAISTITTSSEDGFTFTNASTPGTVAWKINNTSGADVAIVWTNSSGNVFTAADADITVKDGETDIITALSYGDGDVYIAQVSNLS